MLKLVSYKNIEDIPKKFIDQESGKVKLLNERSFREDKFTESTSELINKEATGFFEYFRWHPTRNPDGPEFTKSDFEKLSKDVDDFVNSKVLDGSYVFISLKDGHSFYLLNSM